MKPLNVLPKFENHFLIRTVRFQVQLEADGYFLQENFSHLQPPQVKEERVLNPIITWNGYISKRQEFYNQERRHWR